MKANLSIKEQNFLNAYIETGNITAAAKQAGSKGKDTFSLYNAGRAIIERCGITLQEIQNIRGITDSYLSEKLREGLEAEKKYFASYRGDIVKSDSFPDHSTRSKYLEIAHRLRGQFVDKLELTGKDSGDIALCIVSPGKVKEQARKVGID